MRIGKKRKCIRHRLKKNRKKLKRGRGFWDNLNKSIAHAYGFSDYY